MLSRATTVVVALLAVGLGIATPAEAAPKITSVASRSESVSTGTWAATASLTSMTFTANSNQLSTITNTGTIALLAVTYKITVSNPTSGTPTFTLFTCAVAWVSGKCSGGAGTQIGGTFAKNSTTTVTSTQVPPLSGAVYLQVEPASVTTSVTVTLGTSITSPTQLRASIKTNQ